MSRDLRNKCIRSSSKNQDVIRNCIPVNCLDDLLVRKDLGNARIDMVIKISVLN